MLYVIGMCLAAAGIAGAAFILMGAYNARKFPEEPRRMPRIEIITDPVERKAAKIAAGVERAK